MADLQSASDAAADCRRHFDQYCLGVIPRLLTEDGMFLACVAMITAIESLAGVRMPHRATGERFRTFIGEYFPKGYAPHTDNLWQFRNRLVHAFNPSPFMIVCRQSRMHLCDAGGSTILNAEDFFADLTTASRSYFTALYSDSALQQNSTRRMSSDAGGRPTSNFIVETVSSKQNG